MRTLWTQFVLGASFVAISGGLVHGCARLRSPDYQLHLYSPEADVAYPLEAPLNLRARARICDEVDADDEVRVFLDQVLVTHCVSSTEEDDDGDSSDPVALTEIPSTLTRGELICAIPTTGLEAGLHELLVEVRLNEQTLTDACRADTDGFLIKRVEVTLGDIADSGEADPLRSEDTAADSGTNDDSGTSTGP